MHHLQRMESSAATAVTNHCAPSLEELAINYREMKTMYHLQGMGSSPTVKYQTVDAAASAPTIPKTMRRMPSLASLVPESGLTDAQVELVTNDVVSAAMAALHGNELNQPPHHPARGIVTPPTTPSSRLGAMTERFLKRSNARRLKSRPAGITGPSSSVTLSNVIDARTTASIAQW